MSTRCYIIDDQPHAVLALAQLIAPTPGLELVDSDTNAFVGLNKILSGAINIDIVFVDIDMPDMDGVEFARRIGDRAAVIFVTGHPDYALDAFDIGAVDYLLKPVNTSHFLRAVERAREHVEKRAAPASRDLCIYVRVKAGVKTQVPLDDLMWVEGDNKYVNFYLKNSNPLLLVASTLGRLELSLPKSNFVRIHKSYIINIRYAASITRLKVFMRNGVELEVGRNYYEDLRKRMTVL